MTNNRNRRSHHGKCEKKSVFRGFGFGYSWNMLSFIFGNFFFKMIFDTYFDIKKDSCNYTSLILRVVFIKNLEVKKLRILSTRLIYRLT